MQGLYPRALKKYSHPIIIILLLIFADCAKIGNPEGGDRDELPPVVVESRPPDRTLNFDKKRIEIEFDEFIQLKNITQELVVSPPLEEKPVVRMKNKTLIIDLNSELLDSTTYTFNFGQAIADLNEGNVLENFEYVFSTGDYLDSLSVGGTLLYAHNLKAPEEPFMVMLFENLNDSAPYLEIPTYVGKSNKEGIYRINNLKADTFRMFALKDMNNNFMYDIPEEEIGFLDSLLILDPSVFDSLLFTSDTLTDTIEAGIIPSDSLLADTLQLLEADTATAEILSDSAWLMSLNPYTVLVDVLVFQEDNKPQFLTDYSRPQYNKISLVFNRPLAHEIKTEPHNFDPAENWYIREDHFVGDSVDFWLSDSLVYKLDTLLIRLSYYITDSLLNYTEKMDTLRFVKTSAPPSGNRRRREDQKENDTVLVLSPGIRQGGKQDIFRDLVIVAENPVEKVDAGRIILSYQEDTLFHTQNFEFYKDSFFLRKYLLHTIWKEDYTYNLFIGPGAMTGIYGLTHDTIDINFRTESLENYGKIMLNLTNVSHPLLVQLLTEKGEPARQLSADTDGVVSFDYLTPNTYRIKIIYDRNKNGEWDTGTYLEKKQAEKVVYYQGSIEVRANWEKEIIWTLEE